MTVEPRCSWGRPARSDFAAAGLCGVVGVIFATLPHVIQWVQAGDAIYIADNDDLLYLAVGSHAYYNHPTYISDPVFTSDRETMYPWLQFVPGIIVAKVLQLGPLGINLVWRTFAGLSIALGWYLVIRPFVARPVTCAALASFLMADIGMLFGQPLLRQARVVAHFLAGAPGEILEHQPQIHVQWRIISPGLSLCYLLFYLWLLGRARTTPTWPRLVAAGIGLGLLISANFYLWTSAVLGLFVTMLMDANRRRAYVHIGWMGVALGLPSIIASALLQQTTSPDWLHRSDLFLPIPRSSELLIPKIALGLLALGFGWVRLHRKDLIHIWALAASGLILLNHQLMTGLQIQNFHWGYAWGPSLSLLIVLSVSGAVASRCWRRPALCGLLVLFTLHMSAGVCLRAMEATQTKESRQILSQTRMYLSQRFAARAVRLAPGAMVAGEQAFVDLAVILEKQRPLNHYAAHLSASIDNAEWEARIALGGYLLGHGRADFEATQRVALERNVWGPWARDPVGRSQRLAARLASYDTIRADPSQALNRFDVRYVALTHSQVPPAYLETGWHRQETGPHWQLWERAGR